MNVTSRTTILAVAFACAVSWVIRGVDHQKIPVPERDTWTTADKDSQYHFRRVARAFEEGLAGSDPFLSYPDGSPIPWPPYYTALAWAWTAPGAPADPDARRDWIERKVTSLPRWFGTATSGLVAVAAGVLAGPAGALAAGTSHALSSASILTSRVGNGDHHAFIALIHLAMLLLATLGLREDALTDRRGSARRGALLGAIGGLALGSWVASTVYLLHLQLVLGWLVVRHSRRPMPGLPALGLAFHVAAIVVVLPAVATSPWTTEQPWTVVNLAWFHPLWLAAGALVFVPLLRDRPGAALRRYPVVVAVALAGLGLLLFVTGLGPGAGIREGFAWVRREDVFMSVVGESRGLIGPGARDPAQVLGGGVFLMPLAWGWCAWRAFRGGRTDLLPWAVSLPLLAVQAARQSRFADVLAGPLAIVCVWAIVDLWRRRFPATSHLHAGLAAAALLALTLLAHQVVLRYTAVRVQRDPTAPGVPQPPADAVATDLAAWIRAHTPTPADWSVLAPWTFGHTLEWVADRPTVATNFGPFTGVEAFRAPAEFFVTSDPAAARAVLDRHRARYVLVTTWLPDQLGHMVRTVDPSLESLPRYLDPDAGRLSLRADWYRTLGARLIFDGGVLRDDGSIAEQLDFLRLVHASPERDERYARMPGRVPPLGAVWERVPGAIVEVAGFPGERLTVGVGVRYPAAAWDLAWRGSADVGADGVARVRVPYATDAPNGDGVATGAAGWAIGERSGRVQIPERAVAGGGVVRPETP
jgi:asparagine N-glycosylation enzyme membrane subunit Stt3